MANLSSEERRKRYSTIARKEDIEQSEARKDINLNTKADERRSRYASKDYLEKYNAYHAPTRYDGSAVNRYLNAYGLNQQRQADRMQEYRNRYAQQQFMNAQRDAIRNGVDNGNNPLGLKNLENPLDNMRRLEAYKEAYGKNHKLSYDESQKLEKAYGKYNRQQLEQLKEHFKNAPERDYSGEIAWVNEKLLKTATGKENKQRQNILESQIKDADNRLERLQEAYADRLVGGGTDNGDYLDKVNQIKREKSQLQNELNDYKELTNYSDQDDFGKYKLLGEANPNNPVRFFRTHSDEQANAIFDPTIRNEVDTAHHESTYTGGGSNQSDRALYRAITDEEADNYSYILGKYGQEEADKYLQAVAKHTDVNGSLNALQEAQEQGYKNPLLRTAESIGLGLITPVEAAKNLISGDEVRTYDDYKLAGRQEALRSGAAEKLTGGNEIGTFLYNTATSAADNLLRYAVGGGVGAVTGDAGAAEGAMRLMMGGQVMDSAMKNALDRGLSDSQAVTTALISAVNEELFETISLSNLKAMQSVTPKNYRELAKNIGKQFLGEGSEEMFTDIGNAIADDLVNGEKSEIRQNILNYMKQGMSEEEAKKQASVDFALQLVESGLSGGITGAAMGGAVAVDQAKSIKANQKYTELFNTYKESGLSEEDAVNTALSEVMNGLQTVRDKEGNVKDYKGLNKSIDKAIASAKNINENVKNIEAEMNGVAPVIEEDIRDNKENIRDNKENIRDNKENIRDNEVNNEYLTDMQRVLSHGDITTDAQAQQFLSDQDEMVAKYPDKKDEIIKATVDVYMKGKNNVEVFDSIASKVTNTMAKNETSLESKNTTSEGISQKEDKPAKVDFKANINGEEAVITSVNKNNMTVRDSVGNETTIPINAAEMTDGASAAVEQAKQYGKRGSRLYLENMAGNIRDYTYTFNDFYNAGKQGKEFYGRNTRGLDTNFLREVYDAGVQDGSKASKTGGLVRNDARYTIQESEARVLDAVGKAFNVTIQMDHMLSHDANGYLSDGVIHISTSAEKPSLVVFSHEFTHRLEDTSPEAYKAYKDYVINYLKKTSDEEGNNVYETREIDLKNAYASQGVELSDKELQDELVANATESFLSDTDFIEDLVKENKSLAQQILDVLKQMLENLKNVFAEKYDAKSKEGKALQDDLEAREEALKLWTNAIKNQDKSLIKKNNKTRYSMKELETNYDNLAKEYEEAVKEDDEELMGDLEADLSDIVEEYAKKKGFDTLVYHGTQDFGFTKIDTNMSDDKLSFFATDSLEIANSYSDAISEDSYVRKVSDKSSNLGNYEFYANTNNFYEVDAHGQNWNQLRINDNESLLEDINELHNLMKNMDPNIKLEEVYENLDGIADAVENYLTEYAYEAEESFTQVELNRLKQLSKRIDKLVNEWNKTEHYDENGEEQTLYWYLKENKPNYMNTRQIAEMAKNQGYDGVLYKNVHDDGGQSYESAPLGNVYNFFNPQQQVKSADAVTYDDKGNVIPLSERFNKSNDDIRFSLKEMSDKELEKSYDEAVNKLYDMNLASEIVKQYAYNKGFTKELYHGTSKFGFTKLDTKYSDDNLSFFTSDNPELAGTYSGYGNKKKIYEYTNIDKMNINEVVKAFNNLTTKELKNHPDYVNEKFNAKITSDNKIDIEGYGEHDLESAKTFLKRIKLNNDGVYSFYGNLDNMLEIDAKNNNWNQIPIDNKENEIINKLKSYNKLLGDSGLSSVSLRYLSTNVGYLVDSLNFNFIVAEENNENIKNKEMLLKAAKELDDIKNNWVEKEHLDNDGKPLDFYNYVKNNLPKRYTTRQIAKMAKEDGYDGVIIKNVYDNGGQNVYHSYDWDDYEEYSKGNLYNFFNPQQQLKSADPITYDDEGNVIPLSERFNKSNDDIRFSLKEDSEGNKLSKEQQEYFKDSKVRDADGNLQVLYHQTDADFTVFDPKKKGAGSSDYLTPYGIFMKPGNNNIGLKGNKQMKLYANITNILTVNSRYELEKLLKQNDKIEKGIESIKNIDTEFKEKYDAADKATMDYLKSSSKPGHRTRIKEDPEADRLFKEEQKVLDEWTNAYDVRSAEVKKMVDEYLKSKGYDGVHIIHDEGSFGRRVETFIAFNPNQVKNVDNKKPTDNPDIRYSLKEDSEGNKLSEQQQEYFKDSKVRDAEGRLLTMYHGTKADFTIFDKNKIGSTGAFEGSGFNYTPSELRANSYGGNVMKGYINVTNPLSAEKVTMTPRQLANIIKAIDPTGDNIIANYARNTSDYGKQSFIDRESLYTAKEVINFAENDVDIYSDLSASSGGNIDLIDYFNKLGYDGLIHYDDEGNIKTVITFNSNQFKNVDNKKPTDNPDIRYSLKEDSEGNKLSEQQQKFFKDSKAVDENGNLLVLYHGTYEDFNEFKANEYITEQKGISLIKGYFSEDEDYAKSYGDTKKYYLNIKNPLVLLKSQMTLQQWKKFFKENGINDVVFDSSVTGKNGTKDSLKGDNYNGTFYYSFVDIFDGGSYWYGDGNLTEKIAEAGFDGIQTNDEEEKAWMPFDSNAIKLLENKKPTDNLDIRFSLKEESNINRNDVAALTGNNEYMAEAVNDLEETLNNRYGDLLFDVKNYELYDVFDEICKQYNIKGYSKQKFARNVKELFDYIKNVDHPDGVDTTMLAMQVAADMLDKGSVLDTTMLEMYPTLPEELRNKKIKISQQDRADLDGGYARFRRKYFGNLTLTDEGTEVDTVYEGLSAQYPELFPADITHPADRLTQIGNVVDLFKRTLDHIQGASKEESAFIIAQDIINKAVLERTKHEDSIAKNKRLDIQAKVREQVANLKKAEKEIYYENIRLRRRIKSLESLNNNANNKIAKQEKEWEDYKSGKKQVKGQEKFYRKQYYEKLKEEFVLGEVTRSKAKNRAERQATIDMIKNLTNKLSRTVLRPSENNYVPTYLLNSMIDVLQMIDLDSGYRNPDGSPTKVYLHLQNLKKQYEALRTDAKYNASGEDEQIKQVAEVIDRIAETVKNKRVNQLTNYELENLLALMKIINYQINRSQELFKNQNYKRVADLSEKARENIKKAGREFDPDAKVKNIANKYLNNTLSPVRLFKRLEGYAKDGALTTIAEELQNGERESKLIKQTANDILKDLYETKEARKLLEEFRTKKLVYKFGEKEVVITPEMRVALYLHSLNEDNYRHIVGREKEDTQGNISYEGGGVVIPNYHKQKKSTSDTLKIHQAEKYTGQDVIKLTPQNVETIIKDMDEYDRMIVSKYKELNSYITDKLNDTTEELYGYKKATVKNYFPIIVDKSMLELDSDVLKLDKTIENMGSLKSRVNSVQPIYLEGVMDAIERQIDQAALFSGMAIPVRDFKKVWGLKTNETTLNREAQKAMGSYIDRYQKNLQGDLGRGREKGDSFALLGASARGKMAMGALTGNLSVVMKQAASYPTAAGGLLGYQDLFAGLLYKGQRGKDLEEIIKKYTPLYADRDTAGIVGVNINDMNALKKKNPKLYYGLTGWIEAVDKATVRRLWYASENYVKRNFNYEVGSDKFYKEVAKVWEDTVRRTQPIYDTMNRPEYLRQNSDLAKFLLMFKTQSFQNIGILVDAVGEYKARSKDYKNNQTEANKKDKEAAFKQLVKATSSQIIQMAVFTAITAIADAMLHRPKKWADEETGLITPESFFETYFENYLGNMLGQLAFGDVIKDAVYIAAGKKYTRYDLTVAPLDAINDVITGLYNARQAVNTREYDKAWKNIIKASETASQYGLGVPVKNIENLYKGVTGNVADIAAGKNPLETTTTQQMYNRIYLAYQSGNPEIAAELSKNVDPDKIKTKMVSKLKEEDTIKEAAEYRYNSELDKYQAIVDAYVSLGFDKNWVVSAINSVMNKTYDTTGSGEYNSNDLQRAIDISAVQGSKVAQQMYDEKYSTYKADGLKNDEAKKKALSSVRSAITGKYKSQYESGPTSQKVKIRDRLCSLRVAGERLYTYDSMKSWNK